MVTGMREKDFVEKQVKPKIYGNQVVNMFVIKNKASKEEENEDISPVQKIVNIMVNGQEITQPEDQVIVLAILV